MTQALCCGRKRCQSESPPFPTTSTGRCAMSWWCNSHQRNLMLCWRRCAGTLPPSLSNAPLAVLDVSHNQLDGTLPRSFDSLEVVDLSSNRLQVRFFFSFSSSVGTRTECVMRQRTFALPSKPCALFAWLATSISLCSGTEVDYLPASCRVNNSAHPRRASSRPLPWRRSWRSCTRRATASPACRRPTTSRTAGCPPACGCLTWQTTCWRGASRPRWPATSGWRCCDSNTTTSSKAVP